LRILSLLHHWQVPMVHFNTTGQTQSVVSTYHAHSLIDSRHIKASPGSLLNNSPQSLLCPCFKDHLASRSATYRLPGFTTCGHDRLPDSMSHPITTATPIQSPRKVPCWSSIRETFTRRQQPHSHLPTYRPARLRPVAEPSRIPTTIGNLCGGELVEGGEGFLGALLSIFRVPHRVSSFGPEHRLMHTDSDAASPTTLRRMASCLLCYLATRLSNVSSRGLGVPRFRMPTLDFSTDSLTSHIVVAKFQNQHI
jgi:hypothetical protein